MASAKAFFGAMVGRLLFREATVTTIREAGPRLRLVDATGEGLKGVSWTPGDKVQVYLSGEGMRTYTPISWDRAQGSTQFLLFIHGEGTPGSKWAKSLKVGDTFSFFGPRKSIVFPDLGRDVVFFGDETSFAAAAALQGVNRAARYVFEVDDAAGSLTALTEIGLSEAQLVERRGGDAHLEDLAKTVIAELESNGKAEVTMTGRAQTIQSLRSKLSARGLKRHGKVKAYWSVGKAGLD